MKPFLCVYGHTNLDFIMSLEQFPEKNTSVDVVEKKSYFGGTGANVATVAAVAGRADGAGVVRGQGPSRRVPGPDGRKRGGPEGPGGGRRV